MHMKRGSGDRVEKTQDGLAFCIVNSLVPELLKETDVVSTLSNDHNEAW